MCSLLHILTETVVMKLTITIYMLVVYTQNGRDITLLVLERIQ